ncbi:MAG: UDP-N-acetylmuramoyl-L-alanyl-D-glutamate--2,6-diaminopimelate ligase [Proteobacteria bacterium]|nr:UDP-N-acetylmuramoyl-L-alanyl-D-glutamate--2,6-diaminopimelate ligase [Pseudomonadota bacterium]MBU4470892.1 UDP-N-acetylmuramoyl-L-alanyl-D-glutamate--2,6-diaminopimelate ligase [Pseudomonadota bacterium]MCG2751890.1 UDP-N-acetylmuramoyl-L-alanyl-D-glutamate--2,6-diaminopimelate ligase [Desulfobacteraceae bacterium]
MRLSRLTASLEGVRVIVPESVATLDPDPEITSIHYQSQTVLPGGLFSAIRGYSTDGHQFIEDAVKRGAKAVIADHPVETPVVVVMAGDTRKALASVSARFFQEPSRKLCLVGITGTNGKTTTAYLLEGILRKAGLKTGVITTVNYRYAGKVFDNPMTTPESLDLQKILAEMVENGVTHAVMEVSSHAIDLDRVYACYFDLGVFTNLTQDHLDFHKDMETYWQAKKRFFMENLSTGPKATRAVAVINGNNDRGRELLADCALNKISVGRSEGNSVRPHDLKSGLDGIYGKIAIPSGHLSIHSSLVGAYNVENILCAAGAGLGLNLSPSAIEAGINETSHIPGRLEAVPNALGKFVYVDYAHTPDALENVLQTLHELKTARIICVFGCGGGRDKGKRKKMGEISGRFADLSVITTDNPRHENPLDILWEIEKGVQKTAPHCFSVNDIRKGFPVKGYVMISDRETAIGVSIEVARAGDIVLIAGKGHETYQIVGNRTLPFDDRDLARKALRA